MQHLGQMMVSYLRYVLLCVVAKEYVGSVTKLFGGKLQVMIEGAGGPDAKWRKGYDTDLSVSRARVEDFLKWLEG